MQRTLTKEIELEGVGLHSGEPCRVRMKPAPADTGIVFSRTDKGVRISANLQAVCDTAYATSLGVNGSRVKTVEHLLAALAGMGVDNIEVEIEGPEVPILDGSSGVFSDAILEAGISEQPARRMYLRITKPFIFREGDAEVTVLPYPGRLITYHISYPHRLLGNQQMSYEMEDGSFCREIAPARTFGFLKDVQTLRANGLAKGGSLDNAVILSDTGIVNPSGLRFKNEFLRHKLLDFIGDLSLMGFPIIGHIIARKTGHATNLRFAAGLLQAADCWELALDGETAEAAAKPSIKYA